MRRLDSAWTSPANLARRNILILIASLMLTASCGYRSQLSGAAGVTALPNATQQANSNELANGSTADVFRKKTRVAILSLRNDSPEPWLDRIVGDAIRREMGSRAIFDLMNDPHAADLIVRGRIRPLDTNSQSFSRFVAALEYGLTLELDLEVVLATGNIVRLDSRTLTESDLYLASPDIEVTRTNRLEALRRLSDILAVRLADAIEMLERPIPTHLPNPDARDQRVPIEDRG